MTRRKAATQTARDRRAARDRFDLVHAAMADAGTSAPAKCVLFSLVLRFHNKKDGLCYPSMATIAKAVGRDRRNVIPAIAELRDRGWLKIATTKGGSTRNTNKYTFDFKQRTPRPVTQASLVPVTTSSPVMKTVRTGDVNAPRTFLEPPALSARGCVGEMPASAPAPDGAALKAEESKGLAESFAQLCAIWRKRSYGINEFKALKAFELACDDDPAAQVLESAVRWAAATPADRMMKLEDWLGNGAWRKEPPARRAERAGRRGKEDPAEAMARAGGWEFE